MLDDWRALTAAEFGAYSRLAEVLVSSEAAIVREQLAVATIRESGDQHASFSVPDPVRRLRLASSHTMSGSYDDADGWPIDLILHGADGLLSWVERYRTDAGTIQNKAVPQPAQIRLSPSSDQLVDADER